MKFVLSLKSVKVVFMKRSGVLCVSMFCCAVAELFAQPLSLNMPKGAQLRYAIADANGKITGCSIRTVESVEAVGGDTLYTYKIHTTNPDGITEEHKNRVRVTEDEIIRIVDFSEMFPKGCSDDEDVDMVVSGTQTAVPRNPKVGDLPAGELKAKMKAEGMGLTVKMKTCNRRIEGRETISVDAGSFDCWRISEEIVVSVLLFKKRMTVVSWYADGVWLVKSESRNSKGELAVTTLSEIVYPQ